MKLLCVCARLRVCALACACLKKKVATNSATGPPPVKGQEQRPKTPPLPGWQRPPAKFLEVPLFYMKTKRAGVAVEPEPITIQGATDMSKVK